MEEWAQSKDVPILVSWRYASSTECIAFLDFTEVAKWQGQSEGKKWGTLELPVTAWQVFGLMLLAGVGLTVLIALGTILLLTSSPARFDQIMALLKIVLKVAVP